MTTPYERDTDPSRTSAQTKVGSTSPIGDELLEGSGYVPPASTYDQGSGASSGGSDAKSRASDVAGSAADHASDVAGTAKGEAQQVVGEAKDKAADLLAEARMHVEDQSRTQLQTLASKLQELGDELDSMVHGSEKQGTVTDLARQLSTRVSTLSSHLSDREPQDLLADVRSFARQRPGAFIGGALVAGVLAGRVARGAKQAQSDDSSGNNTTSGTNTPGYTGQYTTGYTGQTDPYSAGQYAAGQGTVGESAYGQSTGGPA